MRHHQSNVCKKLCHHSFSNLDNTVVDILVLGHFVNLMFRQQHKLVWSGNEH